MLGYALRLGLHRVGNVETENNAVIFRVQAHSSVSACMHSTRHHHLVVAAAGWPLLAVPGIKRVKKEELLGHSIAKHLYISTSTTSIRKQVAAVDAE